MARKDKFSIRYFNRSSVVVCNVILGVEVKEEENREIMSYSPAPSYGNPRQVLIYKDASYSAVLHEYTHAKDDKESGWQGIRFLTNTDKRNEIEKRAFEV